MNERTPSEPVDPHRHPPAPGVNPSLHENESDRPAIAGAGDGAPIDPGDEGDLWVGRTHWKHFAPSIGVWLVGLILVAVLLFWMKGRYDWLSGGAAFTTFLVVLLISSLLVLGRVVLIVVGTRYRLTSQRLFITRGILNQTVDQTELIRVDDVRVRKNLIDRVFGLGSVEIISTDATDRELTVTGVAGADEVANLIRTHMRALRRRSLFVENL